MTTPYSPISILIADDHKIFRQGFVTILKNYRNIRLLGQAENGEELVKMTRELKPDVVITDITMPKLDGIQAARQIKYEFPNIGIVALSMSGEEHLIGSMLSAGAKAYLLKDSEADEIISAIKAVKDNKTYYCRHTSNKLAAMIAKTSFNPHNPPARVEFNEKEIEFIRLICQQFSNKEIADKLHLSTRTIEGYKEKVMEKMKARNSVGIVIYALQHHIFSSVIQ